MVRNELCVSIPCYFKCPISMEVMKSPVSLSTGVTYDRSSIQRWLETGHTTCPATMQPLSSPSFVPNLTLLRLINLWPAYNNRGHDSLLYFRKLVSQAKSSDESCRVLVKSEEFEDSLREVCLEARKSEEYCRVLERSEGLVDTVMRMVKLFDQVNGKVGSLGMMLVLLDLAVTDVVVLKKLINCLPKLVIVMKNGTLDSRIATAKILLRIVSHDGESKRTVVETPTLISEAYNLVKCDDDSANETGLGLLITLAENSRPLIKELVRLDMVKRVGEILCHKGRLNNKAVVSRIMEVLEMVAMTREGRNAIGEEDKCIEEIVKRLMKVSEKVTEHGVTVLWSVCYKFRDEKVVELVRKWNGVGKCLLLLQSNCKGVVKCMCVDLVKVLRERGKPYLVSYDTNTIHVMAY